MRTRAHDKHIRNNDSGDEESHPYASHATVIVDVSNNHGIGIINVLTGRKYVTAIIKSLPYGR